MNKKIFICLFAFTLSICTFFAQAQTKYLSGIYTIGGNNANYSSIQKAVTELLSTRTEVIGRVTFNIRPGIYNENIVIKPFKGASAKNVVVFKSETGRAADVTIVDDGDNTLYNNSVIRLEGCKYVSFQDLTIENNRVLVSTNTFASVFHLTYSRDDPKISADYNTINRCVLKLDSTFTIFNGNAIGIVSSDINNTSGLANCANYNSIINNTIYGGAFAIRLLGLNTTKPCKGNKINNNKIYAPICGIDIDYNNIPLIANNQITIRPDPSQMQFGIRVRNAAGNFGFYNNQIKNYGTFGIFFNNVNGGSAAYVYNNVISGAAKAAFSRGIHVEFSKSIQFLHNTIFHSSPFTVENACFVIEYTVDRPSSKISLKNNIFHTSLGAATVIIKNLTTVDTFNYNNYFITAGTRLAIIGGTQCTTLASLKTATGKNGQSFNLNPNFPSATNLRLNNKALIRKAYILPFIIFDFENHPRDPEMPDVGADEVIRSPHDLEVFELEKNFVPREGSNTIPVVIKNDGLLSINSLNGHKMAIKYRINNGPFSPVDSFTLSQLSISYSKQVFNLSTPWIIPAPGQYTMEIRVEPAYPGDSWFDNDTLIVNLCVGLNGRYTIGGPVGLKNYPTFASAIAAFECGVGGPTVFDVYPGTYPTPFSVPLIKGASPTKTLTFRSFSGNAADVIIQNTNTNQGQTNHFVIQTDGADYVNFKNLTLTNLSTSSYASGFHIANGSNNITIDSCVINVPTSTNLNDYKYGIIAAFKTKIDSAVKADFLTIKNSTIKNGVSGIQFIGQSGAFKSIGTVIYNNKIDSAFGFGINTLNTGINSVSWNTISMKSTSSVSSEGIKIASSKSDGIINGNKISRAGFRGINLTTVEGVNALTVSNNMIAGGFKTTASGAGIYLNEVNKINLYHNSVYYDKAPVTLPSTSSAFFLAAGVNVSLLNNIFYNPAGGYAFYVTNQTSIRASDNNIYYTDNNTAAGNFAYYGSSGGDRLNLTSLKQAMISFETKSLELNPQFTSVYDLHTVNPLIDNKGVFIPAIAVDVDKQSRNPLNTDIGADEFIINAKDMALVDIQPLVFSTDPNTIKVKIMNLGSTSLNGNTVKLQYSTSPGVWVPTAGESFTPTINTASSLDSAYSNTIFSFSTLFTATANASYQIAVRIDPTNRITGDPVTKNDSIQNIVCTGLKSGVYTIGGTSPSFATFTEAAASLACGITGPVTFNVRPGTYNERFTINNPKNTSATNLIVFKSETGNAADVIINSNGVSGATTRNIIRLNRSSYVQIKNMTLKNASTSIAGSAAIQITSDARNILVKECIIKMDTGSTSPNIYGITSSDSASITTAGKGGSNIKIIKNAIYGGAIGIGVRGTSQYLRDFGVSIDSNIINGAANYGIFSSNVDLTSVNQNEVIMRKNQLNSTGINIIIDRADTRITNNKIIYASSVGMALNDIIGVNGLLVANNMIGGGFRLGLDGYGLSLDKVYPLNLYNNSINYDGNSVNSGALKMDINTKGVRMLNNSIYNANNGFALLIDDANSIDTSDNNNMATKTGLFARVGAFDYLTFDEYKDVYLKDDNGISVDPDYFTTTNLKVTNTFLDAGGVVIPEISKDIEGQPRDPKFPDIGADEFVVLGDVKIESIDNPLPPPEVYPTKIPVVISVKNIGLSKVSGLNVKYFVDNVEMANEVIPVEEPYRPLLPADLLTYTFETEITPTLTGNYTLRVEAYLLNDTTPLNNVLSSTFFSSISSITDGKVDAYVSPVNSTVEQFTPVSVLIKNSGTDTISNFNVNYRIQGGKNGTVTKTELITASIAPQEVVSHTFDDVLDCDPSAVRVLSTYLSDVEDDLNQTNDTLTMYVFPFAPCGQGINDPKAIGFIAAGPFPNPTANAINYMLSLPSQGDVEIQLVDVLGQVMQTTQYDGMQTGINNIQIAVPTGIAPGIYFSHVKYNDLVITQRVVINK
jgi:hypothetical protein